jgi:hypothetical protein
MRRPKAHRPLAVLPPILLACALAVCRPARLPTRLAVEYAGCAEVLRTGPTCLLGVPPATTTLTFWVPSPPPGAATEIRVDGRRVEAHGAPAGEGERFQVELPSGSSVVEVRRRIPRGVALWELHLQPSKPRPPWLREAREVGRRSQGADARRAADDVQRHLASVSAVHRPTALSVFARLPADSPQTERMARALEARRAAGQLLGLAYDATALAHLRAQAFDLTGAERALAEADLPAGAPAEATFLLELERVNVFRQAGDIRAALRSLRSASERASRFELPELEALAEHSRAVLLLDLGRFAEADRQLETLDRQKTGIAPCESLDRVTDRGWTRLLAREAGDDAGDPMPFLVEARRQAASGACTVSHLLFNAELNLALAFLQAKDARAAAAHLAAARRYAGPATSEERLWQQELEARQALAAGDVGAAERRYRALAAEARRSGTTEALWRALVGQARVESPRDSASALALLSEAEDLVDRQALAIPWPGRARFAAQRQAGSELRIDLLLRAGRTAEALRAARRSRARVPRQVEVAARIEAFSGPARRTYTAAVGRYLDARRRCDEEETDDWRLPADRLTAARAARISFCASVEVGLETSLASLGLAPEHRSEEEFRAPAADELILAYHPLPTGWVAFAADASGLEARRFTLPAALPAEAELGPILLQPFASRLHQAKRVRVLAYGPLLAVGFHALPFDGTPLIASLPVVYGLDLQGREAAPAAAGRGALVVADPRTDLRGARDEAVQVQRALAAAGWSVSSLVGDAASTDRVRSALPAAALFHFGGHGVAGGAEEGGELLLAGGGRLTTAVVLALNRTPARVVLAGCETGVADASAAAESFALADAFLVRGSRQVVAASRPVPDAATARLFADFYAGETGTSPDLARLLQLAQIAALNRADPAAASFRVLEP